MICRWWAQDAMGMAHEARVKRMRVWCKMWHVSLHPNDRKHDDFQALKLSSNKSFLVTDVVKCSC